MYNAVFVFCALILSAGVIYETETRVTSEICQVKPQEKHCLFEYMARDRWPHQESFSQCFRWAFDWRRQHCYEIRWADHCGAVKEEMNNFPSEKKCLDQCSGWAK